MIGLDTNVLVRYLTQDDADQAHAANPLISGCRAASPGYVSLIVIAELFWVLDRRYGYGRSALIDLLGMLLQLDDVLVESPGDVQSALTLMRRHPVQLADALIGIRSARAGCARTYTFDVKASHCEGFALLGG